MPFAAMIIGLLLIIVLVGVAVFFGAIGMWRKGPPPESGIKSSG